MNEFSCRVCGKTFVESQTGLADKTFHELMHGDLVNEK
jgi:ribosomal protein S27E